MLRPHASIAGSPPPRRGAILIVVLAMLALFAVIAISFVFYADSEATAARIYKDAQNQNDPGQPDPTAAVNHFLASLIFDAYDTNTNTNAPDLLNALRGHSLMATMYGRLQPQAGSWVPFNGVGTFQDTTTPLTLTRPQWVNYTGLFIGGTPYLMDPEWAGGTRTGGMSGTAPTLASPPTGRTYVAKNAPYTYPDANNLFLGTISPATGEVLVPSFHRDWIFGSLLSTNSNWVAPQGQAMTLRPRPVDQLLPSEITGAGLPYPLPATLTATQQSTLNTLVNQQIAAGNIIPYPPINPDTTTSTGDVQNLSGGVGMQKNDSIVLDVGLKPIMWNGKLIKPLVAPLIVDLDGRLNLDVHGNIRNTAAAAGTSKHISYGGYWPSEVNLNAVISNPTEADGIVGARLGSTLLASSLGGVTSRQYDPTGGRLSQYGLVNWDGLGTPTSTPPIQIPAFSTTSTAFQTSATFVSGGGFFDDNTTAAKALNHPVLFNPDDWPATAGTTARVFPLADLKRLDLRYAAELAWYKQMDLAAIGSPPNQNLVGTSASGPAYRLDQAHARRLLFTLRSAGLDRPGLMANYSTVQQGASLQLSPNYPYQPVYANANPPSYPGPFPTLPVTPGSLSDLAGSDLRNARAVLGPVDLNRPLTDYFGANVNPTPGNVPNQTQAWADRHNLARDIFARLIVATGATAYVDTTVNTTTSGNIILPAPQTGGTYTLTVNGNSVPVSPAEYNALRYLAQLAVNIVDSIDKDDVSTVFIWNPADTTAGTSLPLTQTNNPGTDFQTNLNVANFDIPNRVVFGVEKSKLVINEAYAEITNDPEELTMGANAGDKPMLSAHVRLWLEMLNPTNTPYAAGGSGPQWDGRAQVRFEVGDGPNVTIAYSPYRVVATRFNKSGTNVLGQTKTVPQYLQDPTNTAGDLPPGTFADIDYDFSNVALSDGTTYTPTASRTVMPNNGVYAPTGNPAQGVLLAGPAIPTATGNTKGPQSFEFNPNPIGGTSAAPWTNMILSAKQSGDPPNAPLNAMEYLLKPVPDEGTAVGQLAGPDLREHVVLLRRLANPYLPPNDPNYPNGVDGGGNFKYNAANPINPYVTVDYMDYVPAFDAVNRTPLIAEKARQAKASTGTTTGYDPWTVRFSVGKIQPYAGLSLATNPNNGDPPTYSYQTSCVLNQTVTATNLPMHTFGRHNGTQALDTAYTSNASTLPQTTTETIMAPFDWLVHFDRPLANQLELLSTQATKPHEVSQLFVYPSGGGNFRKDLSLAPWFGVDPNGNNLPGFDTNTTSNPALNLTHNGLYRSLDVLRVKPWGFGIGLGGRVHGRININTIQDQRILAALLDPQANNLFTTTDVNALWTSYIAGTGARTATTVSKTQADTTTTWTVPVPGQTVEEGNATGDRPFKPFGVGEFSSGGTFAVPNGSGIQDTLLRINTTSKTPQLWLNSQGHPYLQAEMARKMMNNVTTVSNVFAVYMTVVYYEVRTVNGTAQQDSNTGRYLLGKEAYLSIPGDLRQQFFAVVDRSNIGLTPNTNNLSTTRPFYTSLELPTGAGAGTNSYPGGGTTTTINVASAGGSVYSDGNAVSLTNSTIVIGVGANAEVRTVSSAVANGTGIYALTLNSGLTYAHSAGECVSNVVPGNPGPQLNFNIFTSSSSGGTYNPYSAAVPYIAQIR